jgi:ribosomal protein S18 acetylase RimI-like enzyme
MQIRPLFDHDIPAVARLFDALAMEYIVNESPPEAASKFVRDNNEDAVRDYLAAGMRYHVAERDGKIIGFVALREQKHLYHLFVDKQYHRQGIAKALWSVARADAIATGNPGVFTVNASNYALPVYQKMGFVQTEPMQFQGGLYYHPMRLDGETL